LGEIENCGEEKDAHLNGDRTRHFLLYKLWPKIGLEVPRMQQVVCGEHMGSWGQIDLQRS
jgi:hypothetical protein